MRKNKFIQRKQQSMKNIMILLILIIGLGYALLSQNLNINGITSMANATWDIHWENVQVKEGSVEANTPVIDTAKTTVTYAVVLNTPGDFYEFTVDAVNAGTIDGMIESITSKLNGATIATLPDYLEYTVSYSDDVPLAANHLLAAGDTETYKVRIKYKDDIEINQIPATDQTLSLEFTVKYKQATDDAISSNRLYNVLKDAAVEGTYAKKYTGEHHDSFIEEPSKDIYYWYAPIGSTGNTFANEIKDKNNVIFANHCWQMVRTTDTGGVKMIYNGEVENDQCLDTRNNHVGYTEGTTESMSTAYYYGTSYTYDSTNNVFSLDGTVTTGTINLGQYTCKSTNSTGTCATLYLLDEPNGGVYYRVLPLTGVSHYSQFGELQFNQTRDSPAYVGYMYNTVYDYNKKNYSYEGMLSSSYLRTTYYYADSYDYNETNANMYTLTNPYQVSSSNDYTSLVGKYTFRNTSSTYSNTSIYYIAAVSGSTMYYIALSDGNNLEYYNHTYTYGNSYTDNGNGTYTINNPTTINRSDYNSYYTDMRNKYICKNAVDNTCDDVWHANGSSYSSFIYHFESSNSYKFSKGYTYDVGTGKYTLNDDNVTLWDTSIASNDIATHHYTCFDTTGVCATLSYVYDNWSGELYYIRLSNGKNVEDMLNEMLSNINVNQTNSTIKAGIDAWYKRYMINYANNLEDTIFCNDRSVSNLSGWDPNGGSIGYLRFRNFDSNGDLSCTNVTDKFSLANSVANLTYPVGLLTYSEAYLLNNPNIRKTGEIWWLASPHYFDSSIARERLIYSTGADNINYNIEYKSFGVRPVVSLKPGTLYTSGDGSKNNPYIVE